MGYWLQGTEAPGDPPLVFYGTEVFEVSPIIRAYAEDSSI